MMDRKNVGFTIIELMLVLAISGTLVVAILVGSSAAINQQRYRDSVSSLKSFIQNQYDQVSNTLNDRSGGESCNSIAAITTTSPQPRGTSDCVIIGRLVTIAANGVDLSAVDVVGYPTKPTPSGTSDIDELHDIYRLGVSTASGDSDSVAWGAKVVVPKKPGTTQGLAMLIVRSPQSGSIMTFTAPALPTNGDLRGLVTASNNTTQRDLCVSSGGFSMTQQMEVRIAAVATTQGDIQIPIESASVCN